MKLVLNKFIRFIPLAIILISLLVFLPTLRNGFSDWDDNFTIVNNPLFEHISKDSISRLITQFYHHDFYPIFYGSLWLDYTFWGTNPVGFHLFNILFHACNALMIYWLSRRIFRGNNELISAVIVSILFVTHPVNVEAIAWATGRKIILSSFFSLLSIHSYLNAAIKEKERRPWIIISYFFFVLGCLSNVYVVITPALLAIIDFVLKKKRFRISIQTKWGFLLIASIAIALKIIGRRGQPDVHQLQLWFNPQWFYSLLTNYSQNILSIIFPVRLSARYPPVVVRSPYEPEFFVGLSVMVLTISILWRFRKQKVVIFGLLWFIISLLPISQLLKHHISRADRFLYLPEVGLFILFSFFISSLFSETYLMRRAKCCIWISFIVIASLLIILTEKRIKLWSDDRLLWIDAINKHSNNSIAHTYLGVALMNKDYIEEAVDHFEQALQISPGLSIAHKDLGIALAKKGDLLNAMKHFQTAIRIDPMLTDSYYQYGLVLGKQGYWSEAIDCYNKALELSPGTWELYNQLGIVFFNQGRLAEAAERYLMAIYYNPDFAEAYSNLGNVLSRQGRYVEAIRQYMKAIQIKPDFDAAFSGLGIAFSELGEWTEADENFKKAIQLNPSSYTAYCNYGNAMLKRGDINKAIECYKKALELNADFSEASSNLFIAFTRGERYVEAKEFLRSRIEYNSKDVIAMVNLAWLLATCPQEEIRDGEEAIRVAETACRETDYRDPAALETLAAAYAECGRFSDAVRVAEKAADIAKFQGEISSHQDIKMPTDQIGEKPPNN